MVTGWIKLTKCFLCSIGQKCLSVFNPATRVTYDVVFQVVSHPCRTVLSMQNCLRMGFISVNTDSINVVE